MAATQEFTAESREHTGTGPNYRLRTSGKVPAVIYGGGEDAQKLSLDARELDFFLKRSGADNSILTIKGLGSDQSAVIREIQRDPVTRRVLHLDLYRVRQDVKSNFVVSVHSVGTPQGVRDGGLLETHARTLEIRCFPKDLPGHIDVDISGMKVNQTLHASDIQLPEGVQLLTDPHETLFTVALLKAAAETTGETTQPEVIGKKKEESK